MNVAIFRTFSWRSVKASADSGFAALGRLGRAVGEGRLLVVVDDLCGGGALEHQVGDRPLLLGRRHDGLPVGERGELRGRDERLRADLADDAAVAAVALAAGGQRLAAERLEAVAEQGLDGLLDRRVLVLVLVGVVGRDDRPAAAAHGLQRLVVVPLRGDETLRLDELVDLVVQLGVGGLDGLGDLVALAVVGLRLEVVVERLQGRPLRGDLFGLLLVLGCKAHWIAVRGVRRARTREPLDSSSNLLFWRGGRSPSGRWPPTPR
jgi:hypothetical protein